MYLFEDHPNVSTRPKLADFSILERIFGPYNVWSL